MAKILNVPFISANTNRDRRKRKFSHRIRCSNLDDF